VATNTSKVIEDSKIKSIVKHQPSLINTLLRKLLGRQIEQKSPHQTALHSAEELEVFKRDAIENKSKHY